MEKISILFLGLIISGVTFGGGIGGGSPPSLEDLELQMLSADIDSGALFDNGSGDFSLMISRKLQPQMTVSKYELSDAVKIPDADFELLRDRKVPLNLRSILGEARSFSVSAGDRPNSLLLIDRRAAARAGVAQ